MSYLTQPEAIQAAIADFSQEKILWLDTEVADYQTNNPRLSLIQILDDPTDITGDRVLILDVLERPELVADFIETIMLNPALEKVFHNANYDRQFLGKRKGKNVTCTLEMVKKIPYYLVPLPNFKLKTLAEKLCHFPPIDKIEQKGDWSQRPLKEEQLEYAKMDPVYVAHVHQRLLQLRQLVEPNPATEDIAALMLRYRQLEHRWQELDTEIKHIKERLKKAMESQEIIEQSGFKLGQQSRTTKKVSFTDLAKVVQAEGIELEIPIQLTKPLQKQLGNLVEQLPVQEETSNILQLKVTELEDEDLPF